MTEAMYGIEFSSNEGNSGYGVLVLETGRVFGGDSSFVYIGSYHVGDGILVAEVKCTNDRKVEDLESIFAGLDEFTIRVEGIPNDKEFVLKGHVVEDPSKKIAVTLTRRAKLP